MAMQFRRPKVQSQLMRMRAIGTDDALYSDFEGRKDLMTHVTSAHVVVLQISSCIENSNHVSWARGQQTRGQSKNWPSGTILALKVETISI